MVSSRLRNLFLLAVPVGLVHVLEQWLFGFSEAFTVVKSYFLPLQNLFVQPEKAFLVLATFIMVAWFLTTYFLLRGGKYQYRVLIFFGALFISEIHHLFASISQAKYLAGTGTGVLFAAFGLLLVVRTIKEMRGEPLPA